MVWKAMFFVVIILSSISAIPLSSASVSIEKKYLSPRQQIAYGILPENIVCLTGLVLIKKLSDNSPACVKPDTAQKLVERGWGVLKEQLVWFEYTPIACQQTPWAKSFNNLTGNYLESFMIKTYFKDQGITILDVKTLYSVTTLYEHMPQCGEPVLTNAYYFLVLKSDSEKMIKLGYKIFTTLLPLNTESIR